MRIAKLTAAVLPIIALLSACGSSGGGADGSTNGAKTSASAPASEEAGFLDVELTDTDGTSFTLSSFEGTPVFVENFATWCSNCLKQLGKTEEAAKTAGDDAVFVALSVETDLDPSEVAAYAKENGFDTIRFAVMTPEMLAAMKDAYGTTALNPPSTPKITIASDGTPGEMVTGFEEPEQITEALQA